MITELQTPRYQAMTVYSAISTWAPPSDGNNPVAYASAIQQWTGIPSTTAMCSLSVGQIYSVASAIQKYEGSTVGVTAEHMYSEERFEQFRKALKWAFTICSSMIFSNLVSGQGLEVGRPVKNYICGVLSEKSYWGPPNFGENPSSDSKWSAWILNLDGPVEIKNSDILKTDQVTLTEIQIEPVTSAQRKALRNFDKKRVEVSGQFWSAATPGDVTPVILMLEKIHRSTAGCRGSG